MTTGEKAFLTRAARRISDRAEQAAALHEEIENTRSQLWEVESSRLGLIRERLSATTFESLCRYNDRNNISNYCILKWTRKRGTPLDTQAFHISEELGFEVDPSELADLIVSYPRGDVFPEEERLREIAQLWRETFGFRYCRKKVKKLLKEVTKI